MTQPPDIGLVRQPTRLEKPYSKLKKLRMVVSAPQPVECRPEEARRYRRRTKTCASYFTAKMSIQYDKSTEELSYELADSFGLNPEQRYNTLRKMRKMRLSQKELFQHLRRECGFDCSNDEQRLQFMKWLQLEAKKLEKRSSDSDEQASQ